MQALDIDESRPALGECKCIAEEDVIASRESNQVVYKDVDWAFVTPPNSRDVVEKKVEKFFETVEKQVNAGRTPMKFLDYWKEGYARFKSGQEPPINGTSVKDWSSISPAQVKAFLASSRRTIEDVAAAIDVGLRRVGMGGIDIKNKAQAWLKSTVDHGAVTIENAQLKKENEQLKITIDSLEGKVRALSAQTQAAQERAPLDIEPTYSPVITANDILEPVTAQAPAVVPEISLVDQYKAITGRKPHPKASEKAIRARIAKG